MDDNIIYNMPGINLSDATPRYLKFSTIDGLSTFLVNIRDSSKDASITPEQLIDIFLSIRYYSYNSSLSGCVCGACRECRNQKIIKNWISIDDCYRFLNSLPNLINQNVKRIADDNVQQLVKELLSKK